MDANRQYDHVRQLESLWVYVWLGMRLTLTLLTLFISVNVKAVSCSLDVSIDFINVFVENDQLDSYVNEKLGALI